VSTETEDYPLYLNIRKNWDYSPHIEKEEKKESETDCHIPRSEIGLLRDFLYRRTEGALLISGKRGVGKTSTIYRAVNDAFDSSNDEKEGVGKTSTILDAMPTTKTIHNASNISNDDKITKEPLPVLVNAPNFEIRKGKTLEPNESDKDELDELLELIRNENKEKEDKTEQIDLLEFKRVILQNLVRRLYQRWINNSAHRQSRSKDRILNFSFTLRTWIKRRILYFKNFLYIQDTKLSTRQQIEIIDKRISDLYRRAVAKEVKKETNLEEIDKEKYYTERQATTGLRITKELLAVTAASFVIAVIITLVPSINPITGIEALSNMTGIGVSNITGVGINNTLNIPIKGVGSVINKLLPILIATIPPIISISWEMKKSYSTQHEAEKKDSIYYRYDYDVSTLESELEETLREISKVYKVIFIIDELDKMDESDVINVIKGLKSLFNQSSALFILVTGEEFFNKLMERSHKRPTEYTLFPQKIFLQRPTFKEMRDFITEIVADRSVLDNDEEYNSAYHKFQNYACYKSKTDFFDLYNVLRDHMKYDDSSGGLLLNIKIDKSLETRANLQGAMEQIYLRKKDSQPSNWYKNDLLLDRMYELLTKLAESKAGIRVKIVRGPDFKIEFLNYSGQNTAEVVSEIKVKEQLEQEALENLIRFLRQPPQDRYKQPFLVGSSTTYENEEYEITGILEEIPIPTETLTKEERNFVNEYKNYRDIVISYINLYNRYDQFSYVTFNDDNFNGKNRDLLFQKIIEIFSSTTLTSYKDKIMMIYDGLTQGEPKLFPKEELEKYTEVIITLHNEALQNFIVLIQRILNNRKEKIHADLFSLTELKERLNLKLPEDVRETSTPIRSLIIESKLQTKQLLIAQNTPLKITKEIRLALTKTERNNNFLVILRVDTSGTATTDSSKKESEKSAQSRRFKRDIVLDPTRPVELKIPDDGKLLFDISNRLLLAIISWYYDIKPLQSDNPEDFYSRGIRLNELDLRHEAIKCFDKTIEIVPEHSEAWYNRGLSFENLGKFEEAIKCFDKTIEIVPEHSEAWYNRGLSFENLGKFEEAINSYDMALEVKEDNRNALEKRILIHYKHSKFWFSRIEKEYEVAESRFKRNFKFIGDSKVMDYDNCTVDVIGIFDHGQLAEGKTHLDDTVQVIIRRKTYRKSNYMNGAEVEIRSMLEAKIDPINSEPFAEDYSLSQYSLQRTDELSQVTEFVTEKVRKRWVFRLNDDCCIWEWAKDGKDIKSSSVYALFQYIRLGLSIDKYGERFPLQFSGKVLTDKALSGTTYYFSDIIPVIYHPAVDSLSSFVREIHCAVIWNSFDIEVSLLFNNAELLKHKKLNRFIEKIRLLFYGRTIDVETFRIHTSGDAHFIFGGNFSGENNIDHDSIHVNTSPPSTPIEYYFINAKHPVVFINTIDHAMAGHDNNPCLWKWEYIPWVNNAPVVFGRKSRHEIDRQYMSIFSRLRLEIMHLFDSLVRKLLSSSIIRDKRV
jgi:tetratricopeptide (TPR) repeat protein/DNA polymerase III delta prime subunit